MPSWLPNAHHFSYHLYILLNSDTYTPTTYVLLQILVFKKDIQRWICILLVIQFETIMYNAISNL